jgi:Right handed beta helix region
VRSHAFLASLTGLLVSFFACQAAHAQATRTWVSGVGDDVNPCSRTAPCKTFAGAISKTAAGGEINCLDPAGFGGVTIIKAMTLNCGFTLGSILVAGAPGIIINAGVNDRVTLRGIQLQGLNQTVTPGTIGIRILAAAAVSIEDCVVTGFGQQGIADQRTAGNTKLFVRNSVISNNTLTGIAIAATGQNTAEIENTSMINNLFGVAAGTGNIVMITRSVISGNTTGVEADPGGAIIVDSTAITGNGTGVQSSSSVRLSNSDVTLNTTGFSGSAFSHGNNRLLGNSSLGTSVTPAGGVSNNLGQQ